MDAVTFYTKAGCHLCEEAETALLSVSRSLGFSYITVDIQTDIAANAKFEHSIPVIQAGDRLLIADTIDESAVRHFLEEVNI